MPHRDRTAMPDFYDLIRERDAENDRLNTLHRDLEESETERVNDLENQIAEIPADDIVMLAHKVRVALLVHSPPPKSESGKLLADCARIISTAPARIRDSFSTSIERAAVQIVVDRQILNKQGLDNDAMNAACYALSAREIAMLRIPSTSARELAIKLHVEAREYLENQGDFTDEILGEIDRLITSSPHAELLTLSGGL